MPDTLDGIRDRNQPDPTAPAVPVTTMDGTASGPVVLHGAEVDLEGAPAPAPAAGPAAEPSEGDKKSRLQRIQERSYRGGGRDAIYERRDSMTLEERQALESLDEESAAILDAQAGQARAATISQAPLAPTPGPAVPGAPAASPAQPGAPTPVASNSKTYKLSVYGQEQEATEDAVIAAGIRALQLEGAADARMRDASTYEARLNAYATELQKYADRVARTAPDVAPAGPPGSAAPTSPGVAAQIDRATVRQALDAFANDDADGAAAALQKAVADAIAAGRGPAPAPTPPMPTLGEVPRLQPAVSDPWGDDQRVGANKVFNGEFAHFTDAQFNAAKAALDDAMADPANHGVKLENLVRTVCRTTARLMPASAVPVPQPAPANPVQGELENRRVLKARIPVTPPAATGRAQGPAPAETSFVSPSEYVQRLRHRSGSNSTR